MERNDEPMVEATREEMRRIVGGANDLNLGKRREVAQKYIIQPVNKYVVQPVKQAAQWVATQSQAAWTALTQSQWGKGSAPYNFIKSRR